MLRDMRAELSTPSPAAIDDATAVQVFLGLTKRAKNDPSAREGVLRVLAAMERLASFPVEVGLGELWNEDDCRAALQEAQTFVEWARGPVGLARRRETRAIAADLAERYDVALAGLGAWYERVGREIEARLQFVLASDEVLETHEASLRTLAR